jgi:O-acetyl-ADP-ribose deacetylase (regulator of RNase III)
MIEHTKRKDTVTVFKIIVGDISQQEADAIVSPANERLTPESEVNFNIFAAAGDDLALTIRDEHPEGLAPGEVELTFAFGLKAKYLALAVAPIRGIPFGTDELLADCYKKAMVEAGDAGAKTIVFPLLGLGDFGWPEEEAVEMARKGIMEGLRQHPIFKEITFCVEAENVAEQLREVFATEIKYGLTLIPRCPKCQKEAVKIIYGLPREEDFEDPEFYSGGCIVGASNPSWACGKCEIEFG